MQMSEIAYKTFKLGVREELSAVTLPFFKELMMT